ncbi:MAG: Maf family protein [Endomicrobium sp.]|jgi:septum formation protein|nr:Maf family protein [Endomicrobium sp.]
MSKKLYCYTSSSKKIILASLSPQRISLLKQWGMSFQVVPSGVDENTDLIKPSYLVKELAYRKGCCVAKQYPGSLVLSADTIVVLNGRIIGKPANKKESEKTLKELNGSKHKVYTGVAIIENDKKSVFYDVACIKMRKLPEDELKGFFGKNMDKACSYAIQNTNDKFVEKIYGDYYTVVGLPYVKLAAELRRFKINLTNQFN